MIKKIKNEELNNTIRFGVMCESSTFKSWEAECLNHILSIDNVKLVLLIYPDRKLKGKKRSFFKKITKLGGYSKLLFYFYKKFFFKPKCFSQIDFSNKFKKIPYINCSTNKKGEFSEYFVERDVENIKNASLDFIILFSGFGKIKGNILNSSRYGVWSYHHNDIENYKGAPSCFWEIYNSDNINGAILYRMTSRTDAYIILKKGYFKTINFSYIKNLENVYFQSVKWIKEVCLDIMNDNVDYINNFPTKSEAPIYFPPNNKELINFFLKLLKNKLKNKIEIFMKLFTIEQWNIGYINMSINEFLESRKEFKINWLLFPSKKESFADPFVIRFNNTIFVLFENISYFDFKTNISAIYFDNKEKKRELSLSFQKPHNVSYPFVFKYNNEIYMIPEQGITNEIALYKAEEFPSSWEKVAVLVKGISARDMTLFKYNDLWWLTCSRREEDANLRLFIYYSADLFGLWQPHKKNPVKTDVRSCRPAGNVFLHKGSLIRPAQDCSKTYGARIILNKINKLTPHEFEEETFNFLEPNREDKFNKGIHTLSSIENIMVVDGKRKIFTLNKVIKKMRK